MCNRESRLPFVLRLEHLILETMADIFATGLVFFKTSCVILKLTYMLLKF
jgi:hypothetical protein